MQGKQGRNYEIGFVYLSFLNLTRSIRHKPRYIITLAVILGPHEPSLLQLNNIIQTFSSDFVTLQSGKRVHRSSPLSAAKLSALNRCANDGSW